MSNFCISSETYKLSTNDIAALADNELSARYTKRRKVVILLGDLEKGINDTLLCGRKIINKALKDHKPYVPAKIAFRTNIKRYDLITPFIKKLRGKYKIWSSNIYHIDPREIRRMKIERSFRNKNSAYTFSNPLYRYSEAERKKRYETLYESMKKGYDDNYPIEIMLLRMLGIKDTVNNGHHRMGIALECKLPQVAVNFSAAGQAPHILRPILRIIANIAIRLKQRHK